ncbi:two component sensor histidine kinase [Ameyamaea chiangmaiensis NBRC 103196]|uniref:histidine kinase n=1 Tax=Ameyamaea chiangmaiensis TaxID=442969 RepID=A0A850PEZ9_9PROT|nr:ATP-binding protein [Ameyamaea chiangmaiensis]MBS4075992.1 HAMP domain-containing protein [Ameyamaea chiangmaiensis]NVN40826.1 HAMP domain-containing protein [Ameyamaea chiangmaiensis]GBQ61519.1 two component sensor histidine kinase [Ameyamaea chiangmaiensis NBRC 103196]
MPETASCGARRGRRGLWPRSLAARTSLLLIVGLGIVQAVGLIIHAFDRIDLGRRMQVHDAQLHVLSIYRSIAETLPPQREAEVRTLHLPPHFHVTLGPGPNPGSDVDIIEHPPFPTDNAPPFHGHHGPPGPGFPDSGGFSDHPPPDRGPPVDGPPHHDFDDEPPGSPGRHGPPPHMPVPMIAPGGMPIALPHWLMPRNVVSSHAPGSNERALSFLLPDDTRWLTIDYSLGRPGFLTSPTLPLAFLLMTLAGGTLILWGVRRLIAPVQTLAAAAEALGRDVNAPPLPEDGPTEIARASAAFNTMAARIRRFVTDRTLMLTAIGHDLRTPITRLKLRSEFIDDDDLRQKFLQDLDEMEAMVAATLSFGRDSARQESMVPLDLTALLQTIIDEATEGRADLAELVDFTVEPPQVMIRARPVSLKRALNNVMNNAIKYGGSAHVTLSVDRGAARDGTDIAIICIDDEGPGLADDELEQMFEPFVRAETSRNRETGGSGLGLAIARTIVRGHGGDIVLQRRPAGGLRARVSLPI